MTHYICIGTCNGESDKPGVCEASGCTREEMPLNSCDCTDGSHDQVGPEVVPSKKDAEEESSDSGEDFQ